MHRRLMQQLRDYTSTFLRPRNLLMTPEITGLPPGDRIVVFSPHFDDEVIGCGGTLHKHVLSQKEITVFYLTDGREGDPEFSDKVELGRMRREESIRATGHLGIKRHVFLEEPESRLKALPRLIRRLRMDMEKLKPDLIYIPSFLENNVDHFETNRLLLRIWDIFPPETYVSAYEVWTPHLPNMIVDITEMISVKEAALKEFKSQIHQVDYVRTTLALNGYRTAVNMQGKGYAEAFLYAPLKEYLSLLKNLGINRRMFIDTHQKGRFH